MITKENAVEKLQQLKNKSWLTYKQLQEATGIDQSYLHRIISGKVKNPSKATIMQIYNILNK